MAYPKMNLMVKYGLEHKVAVHEAQTLHALRAAFPNNEAKCPELYGWRRDEEGINYLYMSLMPGVTLEEVWDSFSTGEKMDIVDDLREIVLSLRSLEPEPDTRIGICLVPRQNSDNRLTYLSGSINGGRVPELWFRGDKTATSFGTTKDFNDRVQWWSFYWLPMDQRPPAPCEHYCPTTPASLSPTRICISRTSSSPVNLASADFLLSLIGVRRGGTRSFGSFARPS